MLPPCQCLIESYKKAQHVITNSERLGSERVKPELQWHLKWPRAILERNHMQKYDTYLSVAGRTLLALVFVLSGLSKIGTYTATQGYMQAYGLPPFLLTPTIIFEIAAGLAIIVGYQTRIVAFLLAGFTVVTALVFHTDFADQVQTIMFLKNISIAGGLLLLVRHGAGALSLDDGFGHDGVAETNG